MVSGYAPDALDAESLARGLADATGGANVTTWLRANDGGAGLPPSSNLSAGVDEIIRAVAAALEGVTAQHVLVIAGPDTRISVIPLVPAATAAAGTGTQSWAFPSADQR